MYDAVNGGDVEPAEIVVSDLQEPLVEPTVELRRCPVKQRHSSSRCPANEYVLLIDEGEPECYEEAMTYVHKKGQCSVMQD